jgi:hypothetical protein
MDLISGKGNGLIILLHGYDGIPPMMFNAAMS